MHLRKRYYHMTITLGRIFASVALAVSAVFASKQPLTIWIMPNGASPKEKLEQALAQFTQQTGIPAQVQVLDWGEAWNKISTALESGENAPDVLQLGTTWVPYFAARGELKPLNTILPQINPDRFVPISWSTTHIDSDTTIYSVPWFIDIRPVLGNKRILKKNGITRESITTYQGFMDAVRKVNEAKETLEDGVKVRGYAFPGKSDWNIPHNFAPWVWSNGGSFVKKDSTGNWQANIMDEHTLLGIGRYLKFVLDTLVSPEALQKNSAQIAQQFNNGEFAFIIHTAEIIMQTRIHDDRGGLSNARIGTDSVDVFPIPLGSEGSVSFVGGSNLAIPSKSTRPEAEKLILYLTQDDNLDAYTKQIGFLPASKNVLNSWSTDSAYRVLVKALETGRTYTTIPEWGDIEQILVAMFSAVWDQLEIQALYSEEKLYDTFIEYSKQINKRLGFQGTTVMTLAEFQALWHKIVNPTDEPEKPKEATSTDHIRNNLRIAPWLFAILFVFGFASAYKRKRKK